MLTLKVDKKLKPNRYIQHTPLISTEVPDHLTSEKTVNRYKANGKCNTQIMKNYAIRQSLFFINSC